MPFYKPPIDLNINKRYRIVQGSRGNYHPMHRYAVAQSLLIYFNHCITSGELDISPKNESMYNQFFTYLIQQSEEIRANYFKKGEQPCNHSTK